MKKRLFFALALFVAALLFFASCRKVDYNLPSPVRTNMNVVVPLPLPSSTPLCVELKDSIKTLSSMLNWRAHRQMARIGNNDQPTLIYLNLETRDTVHNSSWNNGNVWVPDTIRFSSNDKAIINQIVGEDFTPYKTFIIGRSYSQYMAYDPYNRIEVKVIKNGTSVLGYNGGSAWVNSYYWGNNTPCFVQGDNLSYNIVDIANTVSHEVGHTLGLQHQNNSQGGYNNGGPGNGTLGWAPLMGVGFGRTFVGWYKGPTQNDTAIIANVLDRWPDEMGNVFRNADKVAMKGFRIRLGIGDQGDVCLEQSSKQTKRLLTLISGGNCFPVVRIYDDKDTTVLIKTITLTTSLTVTDTIPSRKSFYMRISYNSAVPAMPGTYEIKLKDL